MICPRNFNNLYIVHLPETTNQQVSRHFLVAAQSSGTRFALRIFDNSNLTS